MEDSSKREKSLSLFWAGLSYAAIPLAFLYGFWAGSIDKPVSIYLYFPLAVLMALYGMLMQFAFKAEGFYKDSVPLGASTRVFAFWILGAIINAVLLFYAVGRYFTWYVHR